VSGPLAARAASCTGGREAPPRTRESYDSPPDDAARQTPAGVVARKMTVPGSPRRSRGLTREYLLLWPPGLVPAVGAGLN